MALLALLGVDHAARPADVLPPLAWWKYLEWRHPIIYWQRVCFFFTRATNCYSPNTRKIIYIYIFYYIYLCKCYFLYKYAFSFPRYSNLFVIFVFDDNNNNHTSQSLSLRSLFRCRGQIQRFPFTFFRSCWFCWTRADRQSKKQTERRGTRKRREKRRGHGPSRLISQTNAADWILACRKMDRSLWITDYCPPLPFHFVSLALLSCSFLRITEKACIVFSPPLRILATLALILATSFFAEAPPSPWTVPFQ